MLSRLTADAESYAKQIESMRSRRASLGAEIEQIKLQEAAAAKVYEYIQQLLQSVTDAGADPSATAKPAKQLSMTPAAIAARKKRAAQRASTADTTVPNG